MNPHAKSLFLCRTPLQARICLKIIEDNSGDDFDAIYFTQNNSDADLEYFSQLKAKAAHALYLHVTQKKPDFLNHLNAIWQFRRQWKQTGYAAIYLASIDSFVFRAVINRNSHAALYSFDDGTANITPGSLYYDLGRYKKARFYGMLLGLPRPDEVKTRLRRHYSIYPGFENFIEPEKITFLSLFDHSRQGGHSNEDKRVSFFIGQPFHEYLTTEHMAALRTWLATQSVDFYVMHPREKSPLLANIPVLDKGGLLAEDAIFAAAGNCRPRVISAYSTVLFNISHHDADKVYLSLGDDAIEQQRLALISKTGAAVTNVA